MKRYCDDHDEEWKVIDYFHPIDLFEVSSYGKIRNKKSGNLISIWIPETNNYAKFTVRNRPLGIKQTLNMHRVLAVAFIPNPYNLPEVNHKDGNKRNFDLYNLEWTSKSENLIHAKETGLNKCWGEMHHMAKLTWDDVNYIRSLPNPNIEALAFSYGVCVSTIRNILEGRNWIKKY